MIKKILKWIFVLVIFVFLFRFLYLSWGEISSYDLELNWIPFLASYLFAFAYYILVAVGWSRILRSLKKLNISLLKAVKVRTFSDFGRFIPGKVWLILGRIHYCKKWGYSSGIVVLSTFMEIFLQLVAATMFFILVFSFSRIELLNGYLWVLIFVIPFLILLMHPKFLNFIFVKVGKLLKKDFVRIKSKFADILEAFLIFFIAWIFLGVGFYLMVYSIYPLGVDYVLVLGASFALAWILSFLAIFVPAGLGVREALITYLLSLFLPLPVAALIAVVSRLWFVSAEVITALIFVGVKN